MKIVWVDWEDTFWYMMGTIEALEEQGWMVQKITWYNEEIGGWDFDRVVKACAEANVAILHFGKIPFGRALDFLSQIKPCDTKTIVISAAYDFVGKADAIIAKPFPLSELIALVRRMSKRKRRNVN